MLAAELISPAILPLKLSDSVQKALDRMAEFRVRQLPLISGKQFLGLLSEENLVEISDSRVTLQSLDLNLNNQAIQHTQHAYEIIKMFQEQQLNVLAVLNKEKNYLGLIVPESILACLATLTAANAAGSIVVLEISNHNSLAHIAQIVESDHAEILSSYVRAFPDSTRMEITLKLNRSDVGSIVSAFQRYNYTVLGVFNDTKLDDDQSDRYDQLMNYLNL